MPKLFRPKLEEFEQKDANEEFTDGVLNKDVSPSGNTREYIKTFRLEDTRYFVEFVHEPENAENEFSLHFGIVGIDGNPITNAGLETFGRIVDEMASMYEEIRKEEQVDQIMINASADGYSKEDIGRVKELIANNPSKLDGLVIEQSGYLQFKMTFKDGVATIKTKGKLGVPFTDAIPVTASFLEDVKHVAKINITEYIPVMLNYVQGFYEENKKEHQRLKLYQFYFKKRYPNFTFNSKEVIRENGKKDLEFEKDEDGQPFLLVRTNNKVLA